MGKNEVYLESTQKVSKTADTQKDKIRICQNKEMMVTWQQNWTRKKYFDDGLQS